MRIHLEESHTYCPGITHLREETEQEAGEEVGTATKISFV
jgi:hypothetical protein